MWSKRWSEVTRRRWLASIGASAVVALGAGCVELGGSDDDEPGLPEGFDDDVRPPSAFIEPDTWGGQFSYTRWYERESTAFVFSVAGTLTFEEVSPGTFRSRAPAAWSVSGGGGDSWTVVVDAFDPSQDELRYWRVGIGGGGFIEPEFHLAFLADAYTLSLAGDPIDDLPVVIDFETNVDDEDESDVEHDEGRLYREASAWNPPPIEESLPVSADQLAGSWDGPSQVGLGDEQFSWHLAPDPDPPTPVDVVDDHPCDGTDVRDGLDTPGAESVRTGIADAVTATGSAIGPEHVAVNGEADAGPLTYSLRLGRDGQPLHSGECIVHQFHQGAITPGVEEPASQLMVGMVQHVADRTRVTVRVVDVETGRIEDAGTGDADGTDEAAIDAATSAAIDGLATPPWAG